MLSWIRDGVSIFEFMRHFTGKFGGRRYDSAEPPPFSAPNHPMELPEHREFTTREIGKLVECGAAKKSATKPHCVLPLGVAVGRKLRLILDARYVNRWCKAPKMRYDNLPTFQRGLAEGDLLISMDFKAGYHHVALDEDSTKYFGFCWQGEYYTFQVLPFGWNVAPYVFNSLSTALVAYLRSRGFDGLVYLDDFCFRLDKRWNHNQRQWFVWLVVALMFAAGYTLGLDKCELEPTISLILLGIGLDTVRQQYWVPEAKIATLNAMLDELEHAKEVPLPWLQKIVGKAQSLQIAVPPVAIFLRSSFAAISRANRSANPMVPVRSDWKLDLLGLRALSSWECMSRWHSESAISFRMETDASMKGWGGVLYLPTDRRVVGGPFTGGDIPKAIHVKELLAVKWTLRALGRLLRDCFLDLYTDNRIVQCTLLKGSATVEEMRVYSKELLSLQLERKIIVRVHRIATEDNGPADALSRFDFGREPVYDRNDHHLNPELFKRLQSWFGQRFTIDACAGPGNKQVHRFISRLPVDAEGCVAVNLFSYRFAGSPYGAPEFVYINPPWPLISAAWAHLRACRAAGVMVLPDQPHQQWYGGIRAEAKSWRILAKKGARNVFFQPSRQYRSSVGPVPWSVVAAEFDFRS